MTESNAQLPAPVAPTTPAPRARLWPLWLLVILSLILGAGMALWSWQQWQYQQRLELALTHLQDANEQLQSSTSQTVNERTERLRSLEQSLSAQQGRLATQQRQIDHNARELLAAGNRTRTDWLLAEAEYLIRIANQRLQIEKDIIGALSALKAADEVLKDSDDVGVYPVRQQLAREILSLKAIEGVDRTGLYLTLEATIERIQQLTDDSLNQAAPPQAETPATDAALVREGEPSLFRVAWDKVLTTLKGVVVVRRLDQPVQPLMSPEQSAYARLNMQLMLEEAEMAVLRGNQTLYNRALAKAESALAQWYDGSDQRVKALLETLTELSQRQVDPELPDISESLTLLKARVNGRLNTESTPAEAQSGGADA
ncbi:uroporphyrinogen-III C-methyltransferase [Marinobacter zhejiangensis]|uniref:Uroporphyrin-3 C-methyltransferase n=1 Tax=Marinobacter zhejiangensis TaxID=488535 RepID=A0A1I4MDQ5_9GAMM|nr:uroporphyrinogen-III C-methyltransferase [Marinobacter zhejiangensis]SFM01236.1 uroporphyrin-3 C-methyltransferase [Marinobacter zhejiangensis]